MKTGVELRGEGGRFERFVLVRELGGRHVPTWLAHAHAPEGAELVVLERYRSLAAPSRDALAEDARRLVTFRHPNLPAIRDVSLIGPDLLIATEFVEGELMVGLRDLAKAAGKQLPIDVGIRGVVDALAALSALHGMEKTPMVHGDVGPQTVLLGFDGVTRLLRPYRGRVLTVVADPSSVQYLAPEQLRTGKGSARADLYPIGVLLWEMLSEKRLFEGVTREGRLARATAPLPKAAVHADSAWAAPLAAVAERALASDPQSRYGSAAEMAAAVRLVVRSKLAMPPRVADVVDRYAGTKVLARRTELSLTQSPPSSKNERRSVRPPVPAGAAKVLSAMRPASRPPTPMPPEAATAPAMPIVPKAPLIPRMGPRPAIAPIELSPPPPSTEAIEFFEEFAPEAITTVVPNQAKNGAKPPPPKPASPAGASKPSPAVAKPTPVVVPVPPEPVGEPAPVPAFARPNTAPLPFLISAPPAEAVVPEAVSIFTPETPAEAESIFVPPAATTAPAPGPSTPSTVPIVTPPPAMRDAELAALPVRSPPNTRRIVVIALILCVVLIAAAGIRKVISTTGTVATTGTGTTTATATSTSTSTSTTTTTSTSTSTSTTTATSVGTETGPEPSASASASAAPSGWAAPRPSNSTARPKPTYDPEGI